MIEVYLALTGLGMFVAGAGYGFGRGVKTLPDVLAAMTEEQLRDLADTVADRRAKSA